MLKQVERTIRQERLIAEGDHVLAAVSGGADSVAMLYLLFSLSRTISFRLSVVHVNHGLRGKASGKDARFVQSLAWSLGLACHVKKVGTKKAAKQPGVSLEMAARRLRHKAYLKVCKREGAVAVAVAHSLEDQAETVLMRLSRGSGPRGLGGMRYSNRVGGLSLIRPCLDLHRKALRKFLKVHGIFWREDASNKSRKFTRNRVRHDVLPVLKKINSSSVEHIVQAAALCRDDHDALELMLVPHLSFCLTKNEQGGAQVHAKAYHVLPKALQRRVLLHWLDEVGVDVSDVGASLLFRLDAMLYAGEGVRATLPGGLSVLCAEGVLCCEVEACRPFCYALDISRPLDLAELGLWVRAVWVDGMERVPEVRSFLSYPQEAFLSLNSKDLRNLSVRCWRKGDVLSPLALDGRKKLQDVFTDAKVPRNLRRSIPLLCAGDEVLWIPGYQIARRCEVTGGSPHILHVSVERGA